MEPHSDHNVGVYVLLVAHLMYYVSDELPCNHPFMYNETIRMVGMSKVQVLFDTLVKLCIKKMMAAWPMTHGHTYGCGDTC